MKLAVIPARGGSRRIRQKNIRPFHGKSIIGYSIEAALRAECFDDIIVSTDSEEIADCASSFGASVPFLRSKELSDDFTPVIPVVRDAAERYSRSAETPEHVCCIYATAPFIRSEDLRQGCELIGLEDSDFVLSVTSFPFPIQRGCFINARETLSMFQPEHFLTRSQDLVESYHDAAHFVWAKTKSLLRYDNLYEGVCLPVIIPRMLVQDIDTPEDWQRAEAMFIAVNASPQKKQ